MFETFALITGEECCQNPKEIVKCSLVISAMCFKFSPWSLPRRKTMVLGKAVGVNKVTNWENKDRLNLAFTIWLPKVYVAVLQQLLSLARLQFTFSQWVELQYLNYTWWWSSKWKKFCQHWKIVKSLFFWKKTNFMPYQGCWCRWGIRLNLQVVLSEKISYRLLLAQSC